MWGTDPVGSKSAALLILVVILGLLLPAEGLAAFTLVPAGFEDQPIASGLPRPTAFDWLPDSETDRLLVTTQGGALYRVADNSTTPTEILNLKGRICSDREMGLLGVAVDPSFSANRFIYLYYTHRNGSGSCDAAHRANRVSRFTMDSAGNLESEHVLIDNIPAPGGNHNGGDLQFGNDGLLYISVGDGGQDLKTGAKQDSNRNARRLDVLVGKILRINPDGGIPEGNSFQEPGTAPCASTGGAQKQRHNRKRRHRRRQSPICQEIFATGLRNPFRIAFDANDTSDEQRFYINDVGGSAWEEIDSGASGADYGWNKREGPCVTGSTLNCPSQSDFVDPIFAYNHQTGCRTITGGAFVPDAQGWDDYQGVYLYADFGCGKIFALRNETPGEIPEEFSSGTGATHLAFGPDGALYYATFEGGAGVAGGQVRKVVAL
jgi:glucose/arabinose dehydrogenase